MPRPEIRVELYLDAVVLHLGNNGRPDEVAVRQALGDAIEQAFVDQAQANYTQHVQVLRPAVLADQAASAATRQIVHEVQGLVAPW